MNLVVGLIPHEFDVFFLDVKDRRTGRDVQLERRKWVRFSIENLFQQRQVVAVDVGIASRVDIVTRCVVEFVGDHDQQECIGSDVEREAEADITRLTVRVDRYSTPHLSASQRFCAAGIATGVGLHHRLYRERRFSVSGSLEPYSTHFHPVEGTCFRYALGIYVRDTNP